MDSLFWTWGSAALTMFAGALCLSGVNTVTQQERNWICADPNNSRIADFKMWQHPELSPPSNLMATLEDEFNVKWTWDSLKDLPNDPKCDMKYLSDINGARRESSATFRDNTPHDLNKKICFKVRSVCICKNAKQIESIWIEKCTFVLKGDHQPLVMDFKCSWYSDEPMECTWHLGKGTPPDKNYILIYRRNKVNNQCQSYTYEEGVVNGCTFINEDFLTASTINILITDSTKTLGRFYTSVEPISILRPRPLNISLSKLPNDRIRVTWNDSKHSKKDYEVQWKNSKSENWTTNSVSGQTEYTTDGINPGSKYTVQVRSKFNKYYGGKVWSDWSTEADIGEHREDDWTLYYVLLSAVVFAVSTATILLLVFLKRLRVLICPPVPDPSKLLFRMFSEHSEECKHWIQHDSAMFHENPIKEEICAVVLVETETSPEMQHD